MEKEKKKLLVFAAFCPSVNCVSLGCVCKVLAHLSCLMVLGWRGRCCGRCCVRLSRRCQIVAIRNAGRRGERK